MSRRIEWFSAGHAAWGALVVAAVCLLGACSSGPNGVDVASIPGSGFSAEDLQSPDGAASATRKATPALAAASESQSGAARWGEPSSLLSEARQLRQSGQKARALALLDGAAEGNADPAVTRERGLLALELGALDKARTLLKAAADNGPPDWRIYSGLGSALAASGRQQEAQAQFARALEIAPDHPSILNNLALSYALDGRHDQAEKLLRRAAQAQAAKPQAKQNLALLLALKGQTDDAKKVAEAVLPPDQARSNASYAAQLTTAGNASAATGDVVQRSADARSSGEAPVYRLGGPSQ